MKHRNITEHRVRALKPRAARYAITEDGLIVEVHPSGRKSFYAKYREHGTQHKERLGEHPAVSVKEAREKVLAIRHRLTVQQRPVKQSNMTLKAFLEGPFEDWALSSREDGKGTMQRLRYHFITENPALGNTQLKKLSREQIERWKLEAGEGRMPGTVKRAFGDFRRALNLAVEWEYLRTSPAQGIKPPKVDEEAEKLYLDEAEFARLTKAIEQWEYNSYFGSKMERYLHPLWFVIYLRVALNTGGRPGEILKLHWKDINQEGRSITFSGITTKSRRTRRIPISDDLLKHLQTFNQSRIGSDSEGGDILMSDDSPVFPVNSVRKPWARLMEMSKLDITPHTLRHHVASQLVLRGVALSVVRDLLGHRSLSVTTRYLSVRTSDKLDALNLL